MKQGENCQLLVHILSIIPVPFLVLMPLKLKKKPNPHRAKPLENHLERARQRTFCLITFTSVETLILRTHRRNILLWLSKMK